MIEKNIDFKFNIIKNDWKNIDWKNIFFIYIRLYQKKFFSSFYQRNLNSIFLEFLWFHFIKLIIKANQNNTFQWYFTICKSLQYNLSEISLFYFSKISLIYLQILFKQSIFFMKNHQVIRLFYSIYNNCRNVLYKF